MEHSLGKAALIGPRHRYLADSSRLDTVGHGASPGGAQLSVGWHNQNVMCESPMAFNVTQASSTETKELETDRLFEETPLLADRCKDFSANRGQRSCSMARCTRLAGREKRCDPDKPDRFSTTTSTREARCWF